MKDSTFGYVLAGVLLSFFLGAVMGAYTFQREATPVRATDEQCDSLYHGLWAVGAGESRWRLISIAVLLDCPMEDN